jgi:hypothetical protein
VSASIQFELNVVADGLSKLNLLGGILGFDGLSVKFFVSSAGGTAEYGRK